MRERAKPELVVYIAGVDPWEGDRLGRLALSASGLAARDALVLDWVRKAGASLVVVLGGGYARRIEDTVALHMETVAEVVATRTAIRRERVILPLNRA